MRFQMVLKRIRDFIAPPVSEAQAKLDEARRENDAAVKTLADMRESVNEAMALRDAEEAEAPPVENGVGGEG